MYIFNTVLMIIWYYKDNNTKKTNRQYKNNEYLRIDEGKKMASTSQNTERKINPAKEAYQQQLNNLEQFNGFITEILQTQFDLLIAYQKRMNNEEISNDKVRRHFNAEVKKLLIKLYTLRSNIHLIQQQVSGEDLENLNKLIKQSLIRVFQQVQLSLQTVMAESYGDHGVIYEETFENKNKEALDVISKSIDTAIDTWIEYIKLHTFHKIDISSSPQLDAAKKELENATREMVNAENSYRVDKKHLDVHKKSRDTAIAERKKAEKNVLEQSSKLLVLNANLMESQFKVRGLEERIQEDKANAANKKQNVKEENKKAAAMLVERLDRLSLEHPMISAKPSLFHRVVRNIFGLKKETNLGNQLHNVREKLAQGDEVTFTDIENVEEAFNDYNNSLATRIFFTGTAERKQALESIGLRSTASENTSLKARSRNFLDFTQQIENAQPYRVEDNQAELELLAAEDVMRQNEAAVEQQEELLANAQRVFDARKKEEIEACNNYKTHMKETEASATDCDKPKQSLQQATTKVELAEAVSQQEKSAQKTEVDKLLESLRAQMLGRTNQFTPSRVSAEQKKDEEQLTQLAYTLQQPNPNRPASPFWAVGECSAQQAKNNAFKNSSTRDRSISPISGKQRIF